MDSNRKIIVYVIHIAYANVVRSQSHGFIDCCLLSLAGNVSSVGTRLQSSLSRHTCLDWWWRKRRQYGRTFACWLISKYGYIGQWCYWMEPTSYPLITEVFKVQIIDSSPSSGKFHSVMLDPDGVGGTVVVRVFLTAVTKVPFRLRAVIWLKLHLLHVRRVLALTGPLGRETQVADRVIQYRNKGTLPLPL